jgi:hypothetical protein
MQTLKWLELKYEQDAICFNWVFPKKDANPKMTWIGIWTRLPFGSIGYFPQKDAYRTYDWQLALLYQLAQTIYSFLENKIPTLLNLIFQNFNSWGISLQSTPCVVYFVIVTQWLG